VASLHGPLEQTVSAALAPEDRVYGEQLTQVVNRLLVWTLQISRDGRPGDKLEVLWEPAAGGVEGTAGQEGASAHEPTVHALRFTSQKLGKTLSAYRYKAPGSAFARYYQADGTEVEERLVDSPVSDYEQITSLLRDGRRHKGVDFKCPAGSPVSAPFDGEVVRRNWHFGANGNCLELVDARSGRHAFFLHLEPIAAEMRPGRRVHKGERLATSGNTGHSTAPHLHYQLESPDGRVLDPFQIHETRRQALDSLARAGFEAERRRLDQSLGVADVAAR
jgi:murein DD-endopeptidase